MSSNSTKKSGFKLHGSDHNKNNKETAKTQDAVGKDLKRQLIEKETPHNKSTSSKKSRQDAGRDLMFFDDKDERLKRDQDMEVEEALFQQYSNLERRFEEADTSTRNELLSLKKRIRRLLAQSSDPETAELLQEREAFQEKYKRVAVLKKFVDDATQRQKDQKTKDDVMKKEEQEKMQRWLQQQGKVRNIRDTLKREKTRNLSSSLYNALLSRLDVAALVSSLTQDTGSQPIQAFYGVCDGYALFMCSDLYFIMIRKESLIC